MYYLCTTKQERNTNTKKSSIMKTKKYIIRTEIGNVNFEWVNGKSHPESVWFSRQAKIMTERQKNYIDDLLTQNYSTYGIQGWETTEVI